MRCRSAPALTKASKETLAATTSSDRGRVQLRTGWSPVPLDPDAGRRSRIHTCDGRLLGNAPAAEAWHPRAFAGAPPRGTRRVWALPRRGSPGAGRGRRDRGLLHFAGPAGESVRQAARGPRSGRRPLDRVAQEGFRRGHRPRRERRPRDRSRRAARGQQGVRDRRRLVRPALRRSREGSLTPSRRRDLTSIRQGRSTSHGRILAAHSVFRRSQSMRVFLACAALIVGMLVTPARADTTELKFGHVGSPGSLFDVSAADFAKRVKEKTGGKVVIQVYGSSQLGDDTELLQKVKLGTVDFALPSTVMSSVVPAYGLFEMPYLVKDREHMKRIDKEIIWPTLVPIAEKAGYKVLATWENGFRQITNNLHPIKTPEDLKRIKLRVPRGKWRVKMFQAYGASPSAMGLSEVFVALQTGVMDGEENPLTQIYTSKFQEVQQYLSMTDHVYTPAYVVTSVRRWNALPADVRKGIEEAARETQAYVYKTGAQQDEELLGKLKQGGMKVNDADKAAFRAASKSIYDEFATETPNGKEMMDKAAALGSAK